MKTIWKFPLEVQGSQFIEMPQDAQILSAQLQMGQICLWAMVDPENKMERRRIAIYGTGHDEPSEKLVFLGTAQPGPLVFHVFEMP